MSSPGIELRWGHGFENDKPRKRERVRPYVRTALDLAAEGLVNYGLSRDEQLYMVVDEAPRNGSKLKWRGEAEGQTCHVVVKPHEAVRQWPSDTIWLATNMAHELFHLVHEGYVDERDMVADAAAEGLATVFEYAFVNQLLDEHGLRGPAWRIVEKVGELPKREINRLEADFWRASARPYEESQAVWFGQFPKPLGFPRGYTMGISAVLRQMAQGYEIPEMIQWEPYHVIDAA